jgi:hypothetical protein
VLRAHVLEGRYLVLAVFDRPLLDRGPHCGFECRQALRQPGWRGFGRKLCGYYKLSKGYIPGRKEGGEWISTKSACPMTGPSCSVRGDFTHYQLKVAFRL